MSKLCCHCEFKCVAVLKFLLSCQLRTSEFVTKNLVIWFLILLLMLMPIATVIGKGSHV